MVQIYPATNHNKNMASRVESAITVCTVYTTLSCLDTSKGMPLKPAGSHADYEAQLTDTSLLGAD